MYWLALRRTFADRARADRLRVDFTKRTADNGGPVASFLMSPLGDYDFWAEVEGIDVPTLVVHGTEDLLPQSVPEALVAGIAGAELALIPDAGHFPFLEQPDAFRTEVGSFLSRIRSR
jgi:pimeloyl-ACP methyl ester carboxylesterase